MTPATLEDKRADARARATEQRAAAMAATPTDPEHAHMLTLRLDSGVAIAIECPGPRHCALWYTGSGEQHDRCGVELEASEVGSEFLEWQIGPEFIPAVNPFPIGFNWTGGGEDDPPEIRWWAL